MKKIIITLVFVLLSSNLVFAEFSDISDYKEDTFSQFITWFEKQGVVEGYDDGTFRPGNNINRVEFLKMLYETIGMEGLETELPFPDVLVDQWYTKYVKEAYASGIVEGYSDGYFRPENYINFAEASKIVMNGFFDVDSLYDDVYQPCATDLVSYPSMDTTAWYWKYINVADELCILQGDISPNVWELRGSDPVPYLIDFDPGAYITRADMAALLYIAKAVKDNGSQKYSLSMFPSDVIRPIESSLTGEIAFDACRTVDQYNDQDWYLTFTNNWPVIDGPRRDTLDFLSANSEGCLSLDGKVFVYFLGNSAYFSADSKMYRYFVDTNVIEEASYTGFEVGAGGITISEFKARDGLFINMSGFSGDVGGGSKWNMKYYYSQNILELVEICDVGLMGAEGVCELL